MMTANVPLVGGERGSAQNAMLKWCASPCGWPTIKSGDCGSSACLGSCTDSHRQVRIGASHTTCTADAAAWTAIGFVKTPRKPLLDTCALERSGNLCTTLQELSSCSVFLPADRRAYLRCWLRRLRDRSVARCLDAVVLQARRLAAAQCLNVSDRLHVPRSSVSSSYWLVHRNQALHRVTSFWLA